MYLLLGIVGIPVLFFTVFWFIPMSIYGFAVDAWYEHKAKKRVEKEAAEYRKMRDAEELEEKRGRRAESDSTLSETNRHIMELIAGMDSDSACTVVPHKLKIPDEDGNLHTVWSAELDDIGNTYKAGTYSLAHAIMRRDAEGTRGDPTNLDPRCC